MSEHALNREQFGQYLPGREMNPHQLAIPGMEEHAHPFATHLARGYTLSYGQSKSEHHLQAWDTSDPKWPEEAASLDWKKEKNEETGERTEHPGEVAMVHNWHEGTPSGRGLAGALFHSAHYFNFGQSTVPIHSPLRSPEGESFSKRVRPDLRPDVWREYISGTVQEDPGKPRGEAPRWPGITEPIHPVEKLKVDENKAVHAWAKAKNRNTGQGRLL